ncbi:MAG: glutamate--tRNA ligase [Myxococcota bacterium]|nr:glutamate--tRNA ligase [Myxococcota bacterium]
MNAVRTRFAPSPTGYLHLGSARTALFAWAYARRHGGAFVLRIEDTDRNRSTEASERGVLEGLEWLGLHWDEGPYRQSERADRYAQAIAQLLDLDRAYRCTCTPDELEQRKQTTIEAGGKWTYDGHCQSAGNGPDCGPHTVRLRVEGSQDLAWDDAVFGPSGQAASEIGDRIIRRSDGSALYNLAVVVDDIDMAISHVIRGDDHQVNTAFQIALYRALDAPLPVFAHLPLLVGESGKKLSKRRDPVSVQQYREEGFLPEAMCSWLARLGWSHGDQEIFARDEFVRLFDLSSVGRSATQANFGKLEWQNQQFVAALPSDELLERLRPFLELQAAGPIEDSEGLRALLELLRERAHTLAEMAAQARWLVVDDEAIEPDPKAVKKHWKAGSGPLLESLARGLQGLDDWEPDAIEGVFERVRAEAGDIGMGKLAQPVRIALTGRAASPGIFETVAALPQKRAVARIERAIGMLSELSE